jgi:hypothetical protein
VRYLSPTSLKKWHECPRRWGFNYLVPNNREPSGAAAEFGSAVHYVLERYERDGTMPDASTKEGLLALEGLPYLPSPGHAPNVLWDRAEGHYSISGELWLPNEHWVEHEFRLTIAGIPFGGKRDLVAKSGWRSGNRTLVDYKTTGGRYMLNADSLRVDVAANLYALGTMQDLRWLGVESWPMIDLYWLYFLTSGRPRVLPPVEITLHYAPTLAWVEEHVLPTARKVWQYYGERPARAWTVEQVNKELAPCRAACHSYGRLCPFAGQCEF